LWLTEAKKWALLLADNKIAENAGWDRKAWQLSFLSSPSC
jgi:hypothetical protein